MKKRLFSLLLVLCMAMSLIPTSVIAEEVEASVCTCQSACTAESRNGDCPVCGAESATEADCALFVAPEAEPEAEPELSAAERVQALIDALPTAVEVAGMTQAERDAVYADAEEAYAAFESLESAEEMAAITGLEKLSDLMDALTAPAETYGAPTKLLLNGVDILTWKTGKGYSYDGNGTLTLNGYTNTTGDLHADSFSNSEGTQYHKAALYCVGDLTIVVKGTNTIELKSEQMNYDKNAGTSTNPFYCGIYVTGSLTIKGGGAAANTLNLKSGLWAVRSLGSTTISSVTLNIETHRESVMSSGNLTVDGGAKLTVRATGNELGYYAVTVAQGDMTITGAGTEVYGSTNGYAFIDTLKESFPMAVGASNIYVKNGAKLTGISCGSGNSAATGSLGCGIKATALEVDNGVVLGDVTSTTGCAGIWATSIDVTNGGTVTGKSAATKDNANAGNLVKPRMGRGIYCDTLTVDSGGNVYGYATSTSGGDGIYLRGTGTLTVGQQGYVYGKTSNGSYTGEGSSLARVVYGIRCDSLPLVSEAGNPMAVITEPYLGARGSDGGVSNAGLEADAEVTGIRRCTLTLSQNTSDELIYGYYRPVQYDSGYVCMRGFPYTGTLDLTRENKATGSSLVLTRAKEPFLIKGIEVLKGTHSIKLPAGTYNAIQDTYITVKNGATLNLYLTGTTLFEDQRSSGTAANPIIKVESGGTLNIFNGTTGNYPSLSVLSKVATPIAGGGSVSVKDCILYARGRTVSGWGDLGIDTSLTVDSGAYVDANIGSSTGSGITLTLNGGTLVGKYGASGNAAITIKGPGANLQLENWASVSIKDGSGNPLYRTEITLYDTESYFTKAQRSGVYYAKGSTQSTQQLIHFLTLKGTSSTRDESVTAYTGAIPIVIPNPLTTSSNSTHSTVVLYLAKGTRVAQATLGIKDGSTETALNYWGSAIDQLKIVTNEQNTAKGALFVKGGSLLMEGTIGLRGGYDSTNQKKILQFASDMDIDQPDSVVWVDYDDVGNELELSNPSGYDTVTGFNVRVMDGAHQMTLNGISLLPTTQFSTKLKQLNCFKLMKRDETTTYSSEDPALNLCVVNTSTNKLYSTEAVFDLSDATGNKLTIGSYEHRYDTNYVSKSGGKLTLGGKTGFVGAAGSDVTLKDMWLKDECQNRDYTFRNLTIENSTVIGMGNVTVTGSLTIDGGSVDLSTDSVVKNSKGNPVYKKTFTFPSGCAGKDVDILQINGLGENSYARGNIFTDGSGRITLWLPSGASVEYACIDAVKYYPMELEDGSYEFSTGTPAHIVAPTTPQTLLVLKDDIFTTFGVTASGAPSPSYLWQRSKDGGTTWEDATNSLIQITDMGGGGKTPDNRRESFSATLNSVNGTELYRCKVSNSYTGENDQETETTVYSPLFTMYLLPAIDTTKLTDQTVTPGETATFSVNMTAETPTGLTASYQWQRLVGTEWTNIDGATGTTYAINATAEMDGWQLRYQVTYTAADGTSRTLSSADTTDTKDGRAMKLVVVDAPDIETQPASATIAVNTDTTFTVVATGNHTLSYQWQRLEGASWSDITDATASSYTVSNAAEALDGTQYRCVVTNSANGVDNTVNSDAATLTVVGVPVVTDQPDAVTVKAGESASFTLAAEGNHTLSYQWQVKTDSADWANITGETETTCTVATTVDMDGWQYRCVVTNTSGSVSRTADSAAATLTVVSAPVIGTHPVSKTIAVNGEATFTAAATGNKTIRYQWQRSRDGGASWSDIPGATTGSYTVSNAAEALDGTQYRCAAINSVNGVDNVRPSDAATLTVVGHPVIVQQPKKVSVAVHSNAVFAIGVTGNHAVSYQWQISKDDGASWSDIPGATAATYTESDVAFAVKGWQYCCIVTNTSGSVSLSVTSEAALLEPVMPAAVKKETVTVPVSSDADKVEVKATVSGGNATVEVSDEQIEKVAQDSSGAVTVDVSGLKNAESATLPAHVVEKADEARDTALTVALPTGSVSLDEKALASISEGEDVTVSVQRVPATDLNEAQQKAVGDMANIGIVVDVDLYVGSAKRSSFNGGKLTISVPYTPKKNEDVSKLTVWFIRDDGSIENMGGYYDAAKKCFVFETTHLSRYLLVNTAETQGFVDVPVEKYFYSAVNWAASNGITGGVDATHFDPYASCTRGQLVTFLWRAAGQPAAKNANTFSDVAADRYCEKAVAWAAENEIVGGYDDGTFRPDATVTRQQTAAILWRFAKYAGMDVSVGEDTNILSFSDALTISDYAFPAIQWAVGAEVMGGSGDKLLPRATCTRAQIVTMLYRCIAK